MSSSNRNYQSNPVNSKVTFKHINNKNSGEKVDRFAAYQILTRNEYYRLFISFLGGRFGMAIV